MTGSLRDQLSEQFDVVEKETAPAAETVEQAAPIEEAVPVAAETEEQKAGRTAGRERDAQGRLLPGAAKKDSAPPPEKATPTTAQAPSSAAAAEVPKPLARPSTLKKELWPVWEKLVSGQPLTAQEARQKAEWILQRDNDYAKGVSTYKSEAESARSIMGAITPFMPALQANNVKPEAWIAQLGNAHQSLVYGDQRTKQAMFVRMAQDYNIDLGSLFVKGNDGQIYLNPQLQQAAPQQQQAQQQPDFRKTVKEVLEEERAVSEVARMSADTEKYPHFATVKPTMIGLLQAGLATDYDSAYQAAIRHPNHSEIFEAQQQQQRETEEKRAAEEKRRIAETARRNAFSPRSATPTAAASGPKGKPGLRDQLTEAFDAVGTGRV